MEIIKEFLFKHRVFLIVFIVVLGSYYIIFFSVYGRMNRRKKKPPIIKNISENNKKDKNISILAPELDDVPVLKDQVVSSEELTTEENDWKKVLEDINHQSDKLNHDEIVDDLIDDLLNEPDSDTES